ncbi:MAG: hypothetical protein V1816_01380 [Pseudomonadota bacterium]
MIRLAMVVVWCVFVSSLTCNPAWAEGPEMRLPADFRAFSPDSPWNQPIAPNPVISSESAAMIAKLKNDAQVLTCSTRKWTAPIFVIDSTTSALVKVTSTSDALHPSVDPDGDNIAADLPIPEGVWPDPERDGHLVLVDPVVKRAWEFSRFKIGPDGQVKASRIFSWDLSGPGFVKAFSGKKWWTIGATAAGLPLIGGLIRPAEFEAKKIEHALICALPTVRKAMTPEGRLEVCPPAARTDGVGQGAEFIPMGSRLQLDPSLDLDRLGLSKEAKPVAKALQRHGAILALSGASFKIFFQNMGSDDNYWKPYRLKDELAKIPVESFRVLDCALVVQGE